MRHNARLGLAAVFIGITAFLAGWFTNATINSSLQRAKGMALSIQAKNSADSGDLISAIILANHASALDIENEVACAYLADSYEKLGQPKLAIGTLEFCIKQSSKTEKLDDKNDGILSRDLKRLKKKYH
ncbi:hypothetical protein [Chitinimonas lacunae]|uniref:Tetratricopeptide repeat protein n=1 Tax=Chitinimonas lacunae TaxID=1963018 RepID=A0ABV8MP38_9NEIS